jgi:hypothetical protein
MGRSASVEIRCARGYEPSKGAPHMAKTAADMVAEARARIENLSVEEAAKELESGEALFVDIREPDERQANGYIPTPWRLLAECSSSGQIPRAPITATSSIPTARSSSTVPPVEGPP